VTIYADRWGIKALSSLNPWTTVTNNRVTEHVNKNFVVMHANANRNGCCVVWTKQLTNKGKEKRFAV
jgi:hypothetical protein